MLLELIGVGQDIMFSSLQFGLIGDLGFVFTDV